MNKNECIISESIDQYDIFFYHFNINITCLLINKLTKNQHFIYIEQLD